MAESTLAAMSGGEPGGASPGKADVYNASVQAMYAAADSAETLVLLGDYDGAIKRLLKYTDWDGIPNRIGLAYKAKGDYQNAIAWFDRAGGFAVVNRGECQRAMGNYNQAIADYTSYIDSCYNSGRPPSYVEYQHWKHPNDDKWYRGLNTAFFVRGLAYRDKGEKERAIADWKKAADLRHPNAVQYLADMGVFYKPLAPKDPDYQPLKVLLLQSAGFAAGFIALAFAVRLIARLIIGISYQSLMQSGALGGVRILSVALALAAGVACSVLAPGFLKVYARKVEENVMTLVLAAGAFALYALLFFPASWTPSALFQRLGEGTVAAEVSQDAVATALVTSNTLNLYAGPSGKAVLIKTLHRGDPLSVTGDAQNGWLPVLHQGDAGWVSADFVEFAP